MVKVNGATMFITQAIVTLIMSVGLRGTKLRKAINRISTKFANKFGNLPIIGEGSFYLTAKRDHTVLKYLKPEIYFYDKSGREGLSYLERLKILLELEKEVPHRSTARLRKIEEEFKKQFGRLPGNYKLILSPDTGLAVRPHGKWKKEEIKFFNRRLAELVRNELRFLDRLNTALWEKVREAKVPVVEKKRAEVHPDIGIVEEYRYGGETFYEYWKTRWKPEKKRFKTLKNQLSDILKTTFKAYNKYGVGLDAHPANWTVDEKGRVRYIDFEPNSVILDPNKAHEHVLMSAAALYLEAGRIVMDKSILKQIRKVFLNHATKYAGEAFARQLETRLDRVEAFLKRLGMI